MASDDRTRDRAGARDASTVRERLRVLYAGVSARRVKQWLAHGRVRVNGTVVTRGDRAVDPEDRVELGAAQGPPPPRDLRIVHEDEEVIVVDKPPGLLTIATETERERTAYRMLQDWMRERGGPRLSVVHRLDRETSGLVVFAKSVAVKKTLQEQFRARTVERVYLARVEGVVHGTTGTLASRLVDDGTARVHVARSGRGKHAVTQYRVLHRFRDTSLLELRLATGRRGQIRAQLAELGHPVVGDRAYGSRRDPLGRVCLHATRLGFEHPRGRRVVFESEAPAGFTRL